MRKQIHVLFVFIILIVINHSVSGVKAYPYPVEIIQPDGTKITIILKGDEHVKWAESLDGYSIMLNNKGIYEYAILDSENDMVPSGIQARNQSERSSSDIQFLRRTKKAITYSKSQVGLMKSISRMDEKSSQKTFPTTGSRKLICILIGFADKAFTKTKTDIENLLNQVGYITDGASGSVHDYYKENSFNQLDLSVTVAGPYTAAYNMAYYGANVSGDDARPRALITEAVTLANPSVNYSDFDNDNDGTVDGVYVIYAGYGEEAGGGANAIWAHAWSIAPLTLDGKIVSRYSCSPELRGNSGTGLTRIGVICHEFGHTMGAGDFYDTDYGTNGEYTGTGKWDIMAEGSWNSYGTKPSHHNPYTKIYNYGWATATILSSDTTITINDAELNSNSFYIFNTTTTNEYFLIENRQQHKFDASIPGHGMIIYHVDGTYINLHFDSNDINAGSHQGMYPVCANATGNPSTTYGVIDNGGLPFPGTGNKTSFTDATTPWAKSWAGNNTSLPIINITENTTDKTITFDFPGDISPGNFTAISGGLAQINLSWNKNSNNDNVLIAYSTSGTIGTPVNGAIYSAGNSIPGGGIVIYSGSSASCEHTGLISATKYYYRAWSIKSDNSYSIGVSANTSTSYPLPFTENFSASSLPSGWATENTGTDITERWSMSNTAYSGGTVYELKCSFQNLNPAPGITRVITPPLNTVGVSNILLSFKHFFDDFYAGVTLRIQSSTDKEIWADETWSLASGSGNIGPVTVNTTIENNLNSATTYVAFVVDGNLFKFDYWYIDNVLLATLPTVTTTAVSDISSTTATSGGNVTSDGGAPITARGVCWSTSSNPTILLGTKTTDGNGTGAFTSSVTGLTAETTYHIRAYATSNAGTAYGTDIQFTTSTAVPPTLTTTDISGITSTTATSGGNITVDGGAAVTARGVCWSTSADPTVALSTKTTDGTGSGVFTSSITGLTVGITYHVRAYATNVAGTGYGNDISFTTGTDGMPSLTTSNVSAITLTTATSGGSITSDGGTVVTERGVCWSTTANPTIADSKTSDGTGTGAFTSSITSLTAGTTYHVRAYATNGVGTSYGSDIMFTTYALAAPVATSPTNVLQASFSANWNASSEATGYRLDVATDNTFTTFVSGYNNQDIGNLTTVSVTGLNEMTIYYYRIRAYNTKGFSDYSNTVTTTTLPNPPSAPFANSADNILQTSFTANWSRSSTATGYRLDAAQDSGFTNFVSGFINKDIGNLTSTSVTGLSANTTYYYRVCAYNTGGTSVFSSTITTITLPYPPPAPVANIATDTLQTSFTANWSNSSTATGYQLDVATDNGFTSFVSGYYDKHTNMTYVSVTGLNANTTYYYRVRAYNRGGPSTYSNTITITTLPEPPNAPSVKPATSILQTTFTANWSSLATATGYRLDVATNPGFTSFVTGLNDKDVGNITKYSVTALSAMTTYYYRVRAYNTGGTGVSSNTINVTTLTNPPAAPKGLTASSCNDLVTLNWSKNTDPYFLRYRIFGGITDNPTTKIDSTTNGISDTSKVITGLARGQTYYFRITAVNYDGSESVFGNQSTAIVKTGVVPKIKTKWGEVLVCYNLGDSIIGYQWYKDGSQISQAANQYYVTNKKDGIYSVETIDKNGCKNLSNLISISGTKSLSVYPNPASLNFALKLSKECEGRVVVSLLNSAGIKVMELQAENMNDELLKEIPVNNLDEGIYIIQVLINNKDLYYTKIIVVK